VTDGKALTQQCMNSADDLRRTKLMQWVVFGLASSLAHWKALAFKRVEAQVLVDRAILHWYDNRISLALLLWRQTVEHWKLGVKSIPCAAKYWKMAKCTHALDLWRTCAEHGQQEKRTWGWRDRTSMLTGDLAGQFISTSRHLTVMTSGGVKTIPMEFTKNLPTNVEPLENPNVTAIVACEHYIAAITSEGRLWMYDYQVPSKEDSIVDVSFKAWDEAQSVADAFEKWLGWTLSGCIADWRDWLEMKIYYDELRARALFRWKHVQMSNHVVQWRSRTKFVPSPRSSTPRSRKKALNSSAFTTL